MYFISFLSLFTKILHVQEHTLAKAVFMWLINFQVHCTHHCVLQTMYNFWPDLMHSTLILITGTQAAERLYHWMTAAVPLAIYMTVCNT